MILFWLDLQIQRVVAQPGSAHVWGAWGRKFESCLPDFFSFLYFSNFYQTLPETLYGQAFQVACSAVDTCTRFEYAI